MSQIGGLVAQALKVTVVAFAVLGMNEWLAGVLPGWHPLARYLAGALLGAVILEVFLAFVFGWPKLRVEWKTPGDPVEIDQIVVRGSARTKYTQVLQLKVVIPPHSWMGHLALRWLMSARPTLQIRLENAPLTPDVENSRLHEGRPTVTPNDAVHGFDIDLWSALRRAGAWHWATVRWELQQIPDDAPFNVDYGWWHAKWYLRVLIFLLVRKTSNVRRLRVVRK